MLPENSGTDAKSTDAKSQVVLGVYDPHARFYGSPYVDIEHIFIYWQTLDDGDLRRALYDAQNQNRAIIVTVEPFTKAPNWRDGGDRLFLDITAGSFDVEIDTLCGVMADFSGALYVRWGHEMEDPTGRYPWARQDSEGYKQAYRYFVDACRRKVPRAAFIWSPKGERNLALYYPGDAYVDYVGLAVWGLEALDQDQHGGWRDFGETFQEKYDRVVRFGKPVYIAELGVAGTRQYREAWFRSLYSIIEVPNDFHLLRGIVYFNDREPDRWPQGFGSPDWRIDGNWFADARLRN
ncbi:glycoside hydrolase family 26 protein [Brucella tritici]|uniref:glycoside hydrolase family 26 protein n=1 Tax=Brucella tritici TaxID=94626 RepID=UPI00159097DB|nr:glycosyl hydrolase [Brucella tritici]